MTTLKDYKKALERAKNRQFIHELGDDMYYSSPQYREDKKEIEYWENKIKEFTKLKNWKEFRATINKKVDNAENS